MLRFIDISIRILIAGVAVACAAGLSPEAVASEALACPSAQPVASGLASASIESGGTLRRFSLYVPRSYRGRRAVPLVFDLQASGISPAVELQVTGMDEAAEAHGFIVALPAAATEWSRGGYTWNIPPSSDEPDDVAFVGDLLDALEAELCIDPRRIYAVGYSGGARLASQLACALPERIAAVAAVAGLRYPQLGEDGCNDGGRAVPVLAFHSLDDPVNPYRVSASAHPPYWAYGIDAALTRWAAHNGCAPAPKREHVARDIERLRYDGCRRGAAVELYRLSGTGHTWPGSDFAFPDFVGATETRIDATAIMVSFLTHYRLAVE
jgi:polyhydroxybutyrate depolymerase